MRHASSTTTPSTRSAWRVAPALLLATTVVAATPVAAAPAPAPAASAAVVSTWNGIAVSTVTAGAPGPTAFNYFAFVHLAMYNAVVGITGEYELYKWDKHAPTGASPEAAAAAAAHRLLVHYFPSATLTLNGHLNASLDLVPDGGAQDKGIAYGVKAADHIIALRANDGRGAFVTVPTGTGAGHWQPLSALPSAAFATAWMGGVTPLAIPSATEFAPGAPPAIGSAEYNADFEEVRLLGDAADPLNARSDEMDTTAKFFSDAGIGPMQAALRQYAADNALDIDDSARMFAAVDTAIADGAITVWNAKLQYMWWRPITAIRAAGYTTWTPFIGTPAYPEWPSGLCSVVGSVGTALTSLDSDGVINLTIRSQAAGSPATGPLQRIYATAADIADDAVDARVWSGIHFRTADVASIEIGADVATYVLDNYFQPTD